MYFINSEKWIFIFGLLTHTKTQKQKHTTDIEHNWHIFLIKLYLSPLFFIQFSVELKTVEGCKDLRKLMRLCGKQAWIHRKM